MSKKSFLENKVFSSIGVGGSLWSLANIKCVAANITRGVVGNAFIEINIFCKVETYLQKGKSL